MKDLESRVGTEFFSVLAEGVAVAVMLRASSLYFFSHSFVWEGRDC
jgi:hypothetical protein